jgi:glucose dehydrogenase
MRITAMFCGLGLLSYAAVPAIANDSVLKAVKNPKNWAMQQGDYANHRYSTLDQINTSNVGKMQTAWELFDRCFSEAMKDRRLSSAT